MKIFHVAALFYVSTSLSMLMPPKEYMDRPVDQTITEQAYKELAHGRDEYRNVGMLEAELEVPVLGTIRIFSASAVYLGDRTIITNAHCVHPWVATPLKHFFKKLYFKVERPEGGHDEYPIERIKPHPHYTSKAYEYDIALCKLESKIPDLNGLEPSYTLPIENKLRLLKDRIQLNKEIVALFEKITDFIMRADQGTLKIKECDEWEKTQELYEQAEQKSAENDRALHEHNQLKNESILVIGYDSEQLDRYYDPHGHSKKAFLTYGNLLYGQKDAPHETHFLSSIICKGTMSIHEGGIQNIEKRDPTPYEGRMRYGFSGGAVLSKDGLIAINKAGYGLEDLSNSLVKNKMLQLAAYVMGYSKYISALGIYVPLFQLQEHLYFMQSEFLNLTLFKDWIEIHRQAWKTRA